MFDYGFNESVDYQAIKEFINHSNGVGGTYKTEYALTLDTAKEIAMLQRTEKGKQARQYFIECEKQNKMKPMSIEEMIIANAQSMIDTKKRLTNLEDFTHTKFEETFTKIDEIKALSSTRPEYFTIVGYASYMRVHVDNTSAKKLGAIAAKLCKERGLPIDKVPDTRCRK
jgi:anti-repressor protein